MRYCFCSAHSFVCIGLRFCCCFCLITGLVQRKVDEVTRQYDVVKRDQERNVHLAFKWNSTCCIVVVPMTALSINIHWGLRFCFYFCLITGLVQRKVDEVTRQYEVVKRDQERNVHLAFEWNSTSSPFHQLLVFNSGGSRGGGGATGMHPPKIGSTIFCLNPCFNLKMK